MIREIVMTEEVIDAEGEVTVEVLEERAERQLREMEGKTFSPGSQANDVRTWINYLKSFVPAEVPVPDSDPEGSEESDEEEHS